MRRRIKLGAAAAMAAALWSPGTAHAEDLTLTVDAPAAEVADWPFEVRTTWHTDAPRVLSVALIRATSCGENLRAGLELDPAALVVIDGTVTDEGTSVDEVTLVTIGQLPGVRLSDVEPGPGRACRPRRRGGCRDHDVPRNRVSRPDERRGLR